MNFQLPSTQNENSEDMKKSQIISFVTAVLALGLLTGCPPAQEETVAPRPERETAERRPAPEPEGEPITITITGDDRMRFDPTEFTVQARQPVTIVFQNIGTMPKESMGHNVVVLHQGVDKIDFANAGARHVRNEYIDPEREGDVIASTIIIGPAEEVEVSFVAPAETGDYDYICSFPGHTQAGMVGVMTVE